MDTLRTTAETPKVKFWFSTFIHMLCVLLTIQCISLACYALQAQELSKTTEYRKA
nr:MAG TPA: hypothetical protein [Caudoviricetes sp.]